MSMLRLLSIFGLAGVMLATTAAQEKKDPPKEAPKVEAKKEEPKKEAPKAEPKKEEPKVEAKKEEPKKEAPKVEAKKEEPKAAPAAGDNELAWKFVKDVPFFQEMTTKTIQNIKVQGLDVGQNQEQTFYFKFLPQTQAADKWIVQQTIEGVKMKIDIAGSPGGIRFNHGSRPQPGPTPRSASSSRPSRGRNLR